MRSTPNALSTRAKAREIVDDPAVNGQAVLLEKEVNVETTRVTPRETTRVAAEMAPLARAQAGAVAMAMEARVLVVATAMEVEPSAGHS